MATKKRAVTNEYGEAPKNIDDKPFYSLELDVDQKKFVNAILNPDNTIVKVASYVPFTSCMTIVTRVALGSISIVEMVISAIILI